MSWTKYNSLKEWYHMNTILCALLIIKAILNLIFLDCFCLLSWWLTYDFSKLSPDSGIHVGIKYGKTCIRWKFDFTGEFLRSHEDWAKLSVKLHIRNSTICYREGKSKSTLFCAVKEIYLRQKIPVTNRKQFNNLPWTNRIFGNFIIIVSTV
jgi:hypothetical protein